MTYEQALLAAVATLAGAVGYLFKALLKIIQDRNLADLENAKSGLENANALNAIRDALLRLKDEVGACTKR